MRARHKITGALVLALVFLLAPRVDRAGGAEKVQVGLLMINADAGVFLAQELGYFREQGIEAELIYFQSSSGPQMIALSTGELRAGSGSISPAVFVVHGGEEERDSAIFTTWQ